MKRVLGDAVDCFYEFCHHLDDHLNSEGAHVKQVDTSFHL